MKTKRDKYRYLAQGLRKYYQDTGSQRVFRNGMNQNELVERMAELGEIHNLEASVLTRAIKGERLLTDYMLELFCLALGLDEEEKWGLQQAALQDRCLDFGIDARLANARPVINMFVRDINLFRLALVEGSLYLALTQLADLYAGMFDVRGDYDPTVPLLRILAVVEAERNALVDMLAASPPQGFPYKISVDFVDDNDDLARIEQIAADLPLALAERNVWRLYFERGLAAEQIAADLELEEGTVHSIVDHVKQRIFFRFART